MNKRFFVALFALLVFGMGSLYSQVTIGADIEPAPFSILELISQQGDPRGLRLTQLGTDEIDRLATEILKLSGADRERAEGLVVFNKDTDCLMMWNDTEFKNLCGEIGKAEFDMDCSGIKIYPSEQGGYVQGETLNDNYHYITIPVNCKTTGMYSLLASSGNGYSFSAAGTLLEKGNHEITLLGQGTPVKGDLQNPNELTIRLNNKIIDPGCKPEIYVNPPQPTQMAEFTIDCANSKSQGVYRIGVELKPSNYITLKVNVTKPGVYSFAQTGNGMSFALAGSWDSAGEKTVTIYGSGTPASDVNTTMTFVAYGGTGCDVPIAVRSSAITILCFGDAEFNPALTANNCKNFLNDDTNFGNLPNSVVKCNDIKLVNGGMDTSPTGVQRLFDDNKPDIVIVAQNYLYLTTSVAIFTDYVNDGKGVLFNFCQGPQATYTVMQKIFEDNTITAASGAASYYFPFNGNYEKKNEAAGIAGDPIMYGPFSPAGVELPNVGWGNNATDASWITGTLSSNAIIYSYNSSQTNPILLRHRTKGFMFCGDAGFIRGLGLAYTSTTEHPFMVDSNNKPVAKTYTGGAIYNSSLFGNMIAWAIDFLNGK